MTAAAVSLSLDAFAVSVCKGLGLLDKKDGYISRALLAGLYFGSFQGLMPLLGQALGDALSEFLSGFGHIIAFLLLAAAGFGMIREAFVPESGTDPSFGFTVMLPLAVATSIDALTAGFGFALLNADTAVFALITAAVTFAVSFAGVLLGRYFGSKLNSGGGILKKLPEAAGGTVLILLGLKILLENIA